MTFPYRMNMFQRDQVAVAPHKIPRSTDGRPKVVFLFFPPSTHSADRRTDEGRLPCMVHGSWCMVHGAWCMVHDAWCMVHGALDCSALTSHTMPDEPFSGTLDRSMIYALWSMLYDLLSMIYDLWSMIYDLWSMIIHNLDCGLGGTDDPD